MLYLKPPQWPDWQNVSRRRCEETDQRRTSILPPITPVARSGDLPLSYSQERMWFLQQLIPEGTAYNMGGAVMIDGVLDIELLKETFQLLAQASRVLADHIRIQRWATLSKDRSGIRIFYSRLSILGTFHWPIGNPKPFGWLKRTPKSLLISIQGRCCEFISIGFLRTNISCICLYTISLRISGHPG